MKLEYAGCSEVGSVRHHNEDAILMRSCAEAGLFLVADGIGGRKSGEVVSGSIRDTYDTWWRNSFLPERNNLDFPSALQGVRNTLLTLNRQMVQRFGTMHAGSTLALLFIFRGNCALVSSGDSRVYRLHLLSMKQIMQDDVYRAKGGGDASQDGRLIGAVGIRMSLEFNVRTDTVKRGDGFFLCSDGVYRYIQPTSLRRHLLLGALFSRPDSVLDKIGREVVGNGAGDNYSMILVRIRG